MKRKWKACLCIAAFLLAVLPVSASADSGPKPQITIQVQNAPPGTCCIDLQTFGSIIWNGTISTVLRWTRIWLWRWKMPVRATGIM